MPPTPIAHIRMIVTRTVAQYCRVNSRQQMYHQPAMESKETPQESSCNWVHTPLSRYETEGCGIKGEHIEQHAQRREDADHHHEDAEPAADAVSALIRIGHDNPPKSP